MQVCGGCNGDVAAINNADRVMEIQPELGIFLDLQGDWLPSRELNEFCVERCTRQGKSYIFEVPTDTEINGKQRRRHLTKKWYYWNVESALQHAIL